MSLGIRMACSTPRKCQKFELLAGAAARSQDAARSPLKSLFRPSEQVASLKHADQSHLTRLSGSHLDVSVSTPPLLPSTFRHLAWLFPFRERCEGAKSRLGRG